MRGPGREAPPDPQKLPGSKARDVGRARNPERAPMAAHGLSDAFAALSWRPVTLWRAYARPPPQPRRRLVSPRSPRRPAACGARFAAVVTTAASRAERRNSEESWHTFGAVRLIFYSWRGSIARKSLISLNAAG
jgi:hypothetical protein